MRKFQQEITTRIQEQRALEAQGEGASQQERERSPDVGLGSSDAEDCSCRCRAAGENQALQQELRALKARVDELEAEKSQYERKLKATKLVCAAGSGGLRALVGCRLQLSISYSLHVCYQSLMTKLSSLKLMVEHTQVEKQRCEERWRNAQAEISELQQLLASKDAEIESLQSQLLSRGNLSTDGIERVASEWKYKMGVSNKVASEWKHKMGVSNKVASEWKYKMGVSNKVASEWKHKMGVSNKVANLELQRMKIGMESLLAANDEKDRHIEELTALLAQYRKAKDMMVLSQAVCGDRLLCGSSEEDLNGPLRLRPLTHKAHSDIVRSDLQISTPRGSSSFLLPSAFLQKDLESNCRGVQTSVENSVLCPGDTSFQNGQWQSRHVSDGSKYQTLPGKFSRPEQNGKRDQYPSPLQLSPDERMDRWIQPWFK
ncbi:hypothetical protein NFI96_023557 [Prochilodus magdalenae]|nr:hypothetical protein NFI96_023557 [Prochilodus magdalenae]